MGAWSNSTGEYFDNPMDSVNDAGTLDQKLSVRNMVHLTRAGTGGQKSRKPRALTKRSK